MAWQNQPMGPKNRGKLGQQRCVPRQKLQSGRASPGKGPFPLKTIIIIVTELVRSLVMSGLAAAIFLATIVAGLAGGSLCLWRMWRHWRR